MTISLLRSAPTRLSSVAERTRHRTHTAAWTRHISLSTRRPAQYSAPAPAPPPPSASSSSSSSSTGATPAPRPAYSRPSSIVRPAVAPPQTERQATATAPQAEPLRDISQTGLSDTPKSQEQGQQQQQKQQQQQQVDWTTSFHGLSTEAFSKEARETLLQPLATDDIEVKPDGIVYLPEIKYRRILNKAFGPGGWGLAPRGETIVTAKSVTREYALVANGRLVSIARGEQDYFDADGIPTATEGCKSNALMRCCKDLGVASELWDPRFIRNYIDKHAKEVWVEHVVTKKRKKITMRKDDQVRYPFKETKPGM